MLFKSNLLTQASGSLGGITASRNRGGMYFRARAIPTDPNTPSQAEIRAILGALAGRWLSALVQANRDAWDLYASLVTVTGPLGDPIILSGQQHFIRANSPRQQAGNPLVFNGPVIFDLGGPADTFGLAASNATQLVDIDFTQTDPWNQEVGGVLNVYVSRPQNVTINYYRGPYRFAGQATGDGLGGQVPPLQVTSPILLAVGQRVFARTRASRADGRLGPSTFLGPALVAA